MSARRVILKRDSLPDAWALLGRALAVEVVGGSFDLAGYWFAADPNGGALLLGPDDSATELRSHEKRQMHGAAVRLREAFTGRARDGREWELPPLPREWTDNGEAVAILYESDKVNGGGTGEPELFRHEFDPGARVYASGEIIAIVGDKITVDASGVRH